VVVGINFLFIEHFINGIMLHYYPCLYYDNQTN